MARALRGELDSVPIQPLAALPAPHQDNANYNRLWPALGHDPTGMDELEERTGLTVAELSAMLLTLELEGRVVAEHGRYCRIGG